MRMPYDPRVAVPHNSVKQRFRESLRDWHSRLRWGRNAPLRGERIWVRPKDCSLYVKKRMLGPWAGKKGLVLSGGWDLQALRISSHPKLAVAYQRWIRGVPWRELGVYEQLYARVRHEGKQDGCCCWDDVLERYNRLDALYAEAAHNQRLRPHWERRGTTPSPRELDGIVVHINRDGHPILGGEGEHRFMIARLLQLPYIPAQLGLLHPQALSSWRHRYYAGAHHQPAFDTDSEPLTRTNKPDHDNT